MATYWYPLAARWRASLSTLAQANCDRTPIERKRARNVARSPLRVSCAIYQLVNGYRFHCENYSHITRTGLIDVADTIPRHVTSKMLTREVHIRVRDDARDGATRESSSAPHHSLTISRHIRCVECDFPTWKRNPSPLVIDLSRVGRNKAKSIGAFCYN